MRKNYETETDRLRRRLQERNDRMQARLRPRLSPFTLVSIAIILILLFMIISSN